MRDANPDSADGQDALAKALSRIAPRIDPAAGGIENLQRLSGGASQETWAFELKGGRRDKLILRRAPNLDRSGMSGIGMEAEARVITRAAAAGVPVPRVVHELHPDDKAGHGFIMSRIEGDALPARIFRNKNLAPARAKFAFQAGKTLAAIHQTDARDLGIPHQSPQQAVDDLQERHASFGTPRPVFSLALQWLRTNTPENVTPRLVHGDFRMGNLMLDPEGINGVLDWELAHIGDPHADLGWLCMESWRFGRPEPVGGLGSRADLFAGYAAAGGAPINPATVRWWEVLAALRWGVIIEEMAAWVRDGTDTSVERHVIARRASETEAILLLHMLEKE
ncbi:phosphotransferase family protein [Sulfitobacter sp. F26169L]|uniref:phosphotransferase family protein n=1 Tax=Sulfitobacter sp. F26169L TaxID=2996015 RepID=UPI0022609DEF|nr:phosphotransferase family protein [Sulfitobacter sp. F26169L]MCX7567926.1 phosphotransferase family protein [Sulfitobacter sp. F26169L]